METTLSAVGAVFTFFIGIMGLLILSACWVLSHILGVGMFEGDKPIYALIGFFLSAVYTAFSASLMWLGDHMWEKRIYGDLLPYGWMEKITQELSRGWFRTAQIACTIPWPVCYYYRHEPVLVLFLASCSILILLGGVVVGGLFAHTTYGINVWRTARASARR